MKSVFGRIVMAFPEDGEHRLETRNHGNKQPKHSIVSYHF